MMLAEQLLRAWNQYIELFSTSICQTKIYLIIGLNRYTKYFLFLREAYTNAAIYLFYFIFVVKAQGVKTVIMKNPIFIHFY
jgi:hypothetical protein